MEVVYQPELVAYMEEKGRRHIAIEVISGGQPFVSVRNPLVAVVFATPVACQLSGITYFV